MTLVELQRKLKLNQASERDRAAVIAMAMVLPRDYHAAREMWRHYAPRPYAGLLDGDGFTWDGRAQAYRTISGKLLTAKQLRQLAIDVVEAHRRDMQAAALLLSLATLEEWQRNTARSVKSQYIAMAALGVGGFQHLTPPILDVIEGNPAIEGPSLAFALDRLNNFSNQMREGEILFGPAVATRAGLYASSGFGVFQEARRQSHKHAVDDAGHAFFAFEKSVMAPLKQERHCRTSKRRMGCVECAARGWVPIGTLPEIGNRSCGPNDRCHWEFSSSTASVNALTRLVAS